MSGRKRAYTLFAQARGGPFTVTTAAYGRGTDPVVYQVCATSIPQAYALAAREVWARDADSPGVREIHHHEFNLYAPYLASRERRAA